jgi:hypothetical protein
MNLFLKIKLAILRYFFIVIKIDNFPALCYILGKTHPGSLILGGSPRFLLSAGPDQWRHI